MKHSKIRESEFKKCESVKNDFFYYHSLTQPVPYWAGCVATKTRLIDAA